MGFYDYTAEVKAALESNIEQDAFNKILQWIYEAEIHINQLEYENKKLRQLLQVLSETRGVENPCDCPESMG